MSEEALNNTIVELREEIEELQAKYDERGMAMRHAGDTVRSLYLPKLTKATEALEKLLLECNQSQSRGRLVTHNFIRTTVTEALNQIGTR